ncbi:MAG: Holliday junction branch migration protein RuvA [Betaproteobacteria bacterium]|jgi:Holliday junction DNA helicase subunit RuvA|nr:Holliday junction branch migration protein RuvA [Betaproteobacteria bacterium]
MIGRLRGRILHQSPSLLVIDVQGVGYEVEVPLGTLVSLGGKEGEVDLYTHLVIREDAHALYGFLTEAERGTFRQLLKITGVGPRLALALLSGLSAEALASAVVQQDIDPLMRIPGIGKKTAQRLLLELKGKLEWVPISDGGVGRLPATERGVRSELEGALLALGYHEKEIRQVMAQLPVDGYGLEEGIRLALKQLARRAG